MRLCPRLARYWMYFRILGSRYQLLLTRGLVCATPDGEMMRELGTAGPGLSRLRDSPAASHITGPRSQCCEDSHFLPPRQQHQPPLRLQIPRYQQIWDWGEIFIVFHDHQPRLPTIFRGSSTCRMWAPCFIISRRKVMTIKNASTSLRFVFKLLKRQFQTPNELRIWTKRRSDKLFFHLCLVFQEALCEIMHEVHSSARQPRLSQGMTRDNSRVSSDVNTTLTVTHLHLHFKTEAYL